MANMNGTVLELSRTFKLGVIHWISHSMWLIYPTRFFKAYKSSTKMFLLSKIFTCHELDRGKEIGEATETRIHHRVDAPMMTKS